MCPVRTKEKVARPERLELPTYWFEANRSIQLSYGRVWLHRIITTEMPASDHREVEIKLEHRGSPGSARALIEACGYSEIEPRTLETDQLFDRSGELRASDRLLRLRRAGDRATVTYKGPGERARHKSREEIEFDVDDGEAFELVLTRLEYQPAFRYEKFRAKFGASGEPGIITLDETPIGVFLELEGEPAWIDRTAARLGYSEQEYVTASYASLYRKYRLEHRESPENMIFLPGRLS